MRWPDRVEKMRGRARNGLITTREGLRIRRDHGGGTQGKIASEASRRLQRLKEKEGLEKQ